MKENKIISLVLLLWGVLHFLIFAYDIQNDRDFWTWLWLLNSQLSFMGVLINIIKGYKE